MLSPITWPRFLQEYGINGCITELNFTKIISHNFTKQTLIAATSRNILNAASSQHEIQTKFKHAIKILYLYSLLIESKENLAIGQRYMIFRYRYRIN
jgi:hypothetical protein